MGIGIFSSVTVALYPFSVIKTRMQVRVRYNPPIIPSLFPCGISRSGCLLGFATTFCRHMPVISLLMGLSFLFSYASHFCPQSVSVSILVAVSTLTDFVILSALKYCLQLD